MALPTWRSDRDVGTITAVNTRLTVGATIIVADTLLIVSFWLFPVLRTELTFTAAVLAGSATVYAAYYAASTLRINLTRDRQARGFAIVQSMNEQEAAAVRVFIEKEVANKKLSPSDLCTRITGDKECLASVTSILGHYDDASIAIQEGWADELVVFKSLGFLVPWTYSNLREYINEERRLVSDNRLYADMERLADAWKRNVLLSTSDAVPAQYRI